MKIGVVSNVLMDRCFANNRKVSFCAQKTDFFDKSNLPAEISKNIPEGYSIDSLILMAQNDRNLRGIGANSRVYDIPYLNSYVLKVLNKDDPNNVKIDEFPSDINLGQPVWQSKENPRLIILKKVEGQEHSIPFWSDTIWDKEAKAPRLVSKEQADVYFNSINRLALMPQKSFDEIALKVKLLSDNGYKIDSINPNNLIVDENEIHIIDYFKVKLKERDVYQNCSYDLIAIMLDFTLLPEYFEKMDENQKNEFLKNAKSIFEKVQQGAENSGLSTDAEIYRTYIKETSKWFITTSAFEKDGREHIRLYDYRAEDFLDWLEKFNFNKS